VSTPSPGGGPAGLASTAGPRAEDLSGRLEALAQLMRIGKDRDGFDAELLADSDTLLLRSSERLRMSAGHTVVAIAGGTGSGKSTLFNALAGASFSPTGVIRPTTREVQACVWGMEGAAPLLDWLEVPRRYRYARASALDSGETTLHGLILLDLPDHDSVIESSSAAVDRISKLADMLIWVLDPQKYADAAVHNRYLVPLAGHAGLLTVVLSQTDLLTPEQADDCAEDLRRLLDSEGLEGTRLLTVSGRTGAGLDEVRGLLTEAVSASHATEERISADIDSLLVRYGEYAAGPALPEAPDPVAEAPDPVLDVSGPLSAPVSADAGLAPALPSKLPAKPPWEMTQVELAELRAARDRPPWEGAAQDDGAASEPDSAELARNVPAVTAAQLISAFNDASGLSAVAEGMASTRETQAARLTSWPLARMLRRHGPAGSPAGHADAAGGGGTGGGGERLVTGLAPQSEVDNAITAFADAAGGRLPEPWPASVRRAARSRADKVPPALADAVRQADPGKPATPLRWRLVAAWHWLLLALAAAALIWMVVIAAAHGPGKPALLGDLSLIPWLAVLAVALLVLGWLTSIGCQNMAVLAADRERERAEHAMRVQVAAVARELVLAPVGWEIATYERFRRELAAARGSRSPGISPSR
jgi:energy-coupling factor transporter ATP-binding protein EcfA2